MFARIIHDPASPTEEVSIMFFFYESLQIAFPNNVLVKLASFAAEVYSLLITTRKRGAGSVELISI